MAEHRCSAAVVCRSIRRLAAPTALLFEDLTQINAQMAIVLF